MLPLKREKLPIRNTKKESNQEELLPALFDSFFKIMNQTDRFPPTHPPDDIKHTGQTQCADAEQRNHCPVFQEHQIAQKLSNLCCL